MRCHSYYPHFTEVAGTRGAAIHPKTHAVSGLQKLGASRPLPSLIFTTNLRGGGRWFPPLNACGLHCVHLTRCVACSRFFRLHFLHCNLIYVLLLTFLFVLSLCCVSLRAGALSWGDNVLVFSVTEDTQRRHRDALGWGCGCDVSHWLVLIQSQEQTVPMFPQPQLLAPFQNKVTFPTLCAKIHLSWKLPLLNPAHWGHCCLLFVLSTRGDFLVCLP